MSDGNDAIMEVLERRLPAGEFVQVTDVAVAMDVTCSTVLALIDDGRLSAINVSAGDGRQARYRILRTSVVAFWKGRAGVAVATAVGRSAGAQGAARECGSNAQQMFRM